MGQIFLTDILEEGDFLSERRKLLRHRAGLTDKDRKKVPKFEFIMVDSKKASISSRVESDLNFSTVLQYLASFAHDLPQPVEVKEALTWASLHYRLNPWKEHIFHEAWAQTEGGLLRGAAAYCMDRFQRYTCSRPGYTVLNWGYEFGVSFPLEHGNSH
ncbi:unnamed protein product [Cladocopium goreaui]|uniref:Uncharacterized protein n=1 Tax=Cladocopium goreaui TaxID=2562237 RepID=A0A9P1D8V3_9DINO|nr:unnamed protein product [Cladocopium goreaui]CAI4010776.1 unnamed protein product [Cladocopium goreaui]